MKLTTLLALVLVTQAGGVAAQQASAPDKAPTRRVAFAQSCFWTGEMKLGQIEGVVRTEAGFFKGREVTLVEYAPERVSLEDLARRGRQAGVADSVHLDAGTERAPAGVSNGAPLDKSYRAAPADDQKKQIEGTPFSRLKLSPEQATKVNAFVREDSGKALGYLTPPQREQLKSGK
jgi:hypothetical protein